jgi:Family of unknown function (DUF6029)
VASELVRSTGARCAVAALASVFWTAPARAVDLDEVAKQKVELDVTETSIVAQHFDARGQEAPQDSGWGEWINRLNLALRWGRWTAGLRLDSAEYWRRPIDNPDFASLPASEQTQVAQDNESRYKNSIYPAKMWVTYAAPGLEVTAGDAYVQFGRGLTLSMRKIDELGIDTTVRGAKVEVDEDPFALTLVAGFGNPARVDEASGRALFPTSNLLPGDRSTPTFGSDRLVGIELQAGRGLPVTLSTHAVRFTRCAPYRYDANGNIVTDPLSDPGDVTFGTCNSADTDRWLASLNNVPPTLRANDITMAGQSLEIPTLAGHGKLYLEAAVQQRSSDVPVQTPPPDGNALYGALSFDAGPTSWTLEVKSNRNFYTVPASVAPNAGEFAVVAYSFVPPAETFNMIDTEGTGNFNACVNGGRFRGDLNVSSDLLVYGQGIYAYTKSEQPNGLCDAYGNTVGATSPGSVHDIVYDGIAGFEWSFDSQLSHVFAWTGARDDTRQDGVLSYREQHVEYSIAKYLGGPWSLEVQGRHRRREEAQFNLDANYNPQWWFEGENYVALRMAPKWVFTQGFEYTTQAGQPLLYFNGAVLYKFTSDSNVRLFVGQQRGAFRCASGVCRYFPPFEGARAELTLRF